MEAPNRNSYWAKLIVDELVRLRCTVFFISPGSRSSPLATAVGTHDETQAIVHYDERGSAFAALGYARATGRPGVCLTTSGTAVANTLPAVIEASIDAVPLLLLTADRPPELRDTGSNQTIRQTNIFADYVRWFFELPTSSAQIDPGFVLTTVDQMVFRATDEHGPAHLNCQFREPLAPVKKAFDVSESSSRFDTWTSSREPYSRYSNTLRMPSSEDRERLKNVLKSAKRPICVLGRLSDPSFATTAVRWASNQGIPVFPDVTSGFRLGVDDDSLIPFYDLILANSEFAEKMSPDAIIQLGRSPVSKRLLAYLSTGSTDSYVSILDGPERIDPFHRVSLRLTTDREGIDALFGSENVALDPSTGWIQKWRGANEKIESWLTTQFAHDAFTTSEQAIVHQLSTMLPDHSAWMLASSLPIRHVDSFAASNGHRVRIVSNRGASGIDGTVATSAGFQIGSSSTMTVLIGDLALLHDLNSLVLAARHDLIVVVLNNDGGGIFSYLPISEHPNVFETFYGTPHGLGFEHAAAMFELPYSLTETVEEFAASYSKALTAGGPALIEVRTHRKTTRSLNDTLIDSAQRLTGL